MKKTDDNPVVANLEWKLVCSELKKEGPCSEEKYPDLIIQCATAIEMFRKFFRKCHACLRQNGRMVPREKGERETFVLVLEIGKDDFEQSNNMSCLAMMAKPYEMPDSWFLQFHRESDQAVFIMRLKKAKDGFYLNQTKMAEAIKNHPLP